MTTKAKGIAGVLTLAILMPFAVQGGGLEDEKSKADAFEAALSQAGKEATQEVPLGRFEGDEEGQFGGPRPHPDLMAKDAFEGLGECSVLNAMFVRQPSLRDAVSMLGPCMQAVSRKYGVGVSVSETIVASGHKLGGPPGIGIFVSGPLPMGNAVLLDLRYAVEVLRRGRLLSYPAMVKYRNLDDTPRLQTSSLQSVVDRCISSMILRPIQTSKDAAGLIRFCAEDVAPELLITGVVVRRDPGPGLHVSVLSRADDATLEAMNGAVVLPGEGGAVQVSVRAYRDVQNSLFEPEGSEGN